MTVIYHIEAGNLNEANQKLQTLYLEVFGSAPAQPMSAQDLIDQLQESVGKEYVVKVLPAGEEQPEKGQDEKPQRRQTKKKVSKKKASKPAPEEPDVEEQDAAQEPDQTNGEDPEAEALALFNKIFQHSDEAADAVRATLAELGYKKFNEVQDEQWPDLLTKAQEMANEFGVA